MLRTETITTAFDELRDPSVIRVEYDLVELRVYVQFASTERLALVAFQNPQGFRVMDEGSLLEFWGAGRSNGWLWRVEEGGWLEQEAQRSGFLREMTPGVEYLVLGDDDCVSVISPAPPRVTEAPNSALQPTPTRAT
jgi:hypothetical protein